MKNIFSIALLLLLNCETKRPPESKNEINLPDSATDQNAQITAKDTDLSKFYGIYDHESSTNEFSGVLSLEQNGLDLYFVASVFQGSCHKEVKGVVMMTTPQEKYPTGFYQSENCNLLFTFNQTATQIDLKEINFCNISEGACSHDGTYLKRATEALVNPR